MSSGLNKVAQAASLRRFRQIGLNRNRPAQAGSLRYQVRQSFLPRLSLNKRHPGLLILILLGLIFSARPVPASDPRPDARRVRAQRMERIVLDGLVTEPAWAQVEPAKDFIQQEPNEGQAATERTEVRLGYDNDNLYIGIICFDSQPENIVVTQNRRDASLTDTDAVIILLDTFGDRQNAFVFGTSPTGIEYDGQVSKAGQTRGGGGQPSRTGGGGGGAQRGGAAAFNLNWDGVWQVRSQITARGWESELVIPFKTLRYALRSEPAWGLNIMRNLRRRNEQSYWSAVPRPFNLNQVDLAGDLTGLELRPHRSLKLLPYVLGGLKQNFTVTADRSKPVLDAGLDLKYSLTSSLTLDATFNTDFAQVEVDEEQINLTRFDLFFPEKRPFFLENSGIFDFGTPREVELFFSRRIGIDDSGEQVPIDAGVRLSGKVGPYSIGLLNMQTRKVKGIAPANNFSVARFSRELPNRSSIGIIGVNRESTSFSATDRPFNRAVGVDANFGLGKHGNWFNYYAATRSPGRSGSQHAVASTFEYDDQHHELGLSYKEVGRNFNPEVGFVRRTGYRQPHVAYRYTILPEGKFVRSIGPHFQWNRWYTLGTNETESGFEHYHVDTRWQSGGGGGLAFNRTFERLDKPFEIFPGVIIAPGRYSYSEVVANADSDPSATLFAGGNLAIGSFYGGNIRTLSLRGGVRRGKNITLTGNLTRNMVDLPVGAFNTNLVTMRFNWSFTPKSYLQTLTQYNSRTKQVGTSVRFALLSTSSTGFFFVYNTRMSTIDGFDPHETNSRTLSRAIFFKFNYLFDF